jgi:hypothetical protein
MASQKQVEANRRNALKSTGPRTQQGKARSRMNALRHGFAAAVQVTAGRDAVSYETVVAAYECVNEVDLARWKILGELENLLQQRSSPELVHKAVRRLGSLDRYSARKISQIRKHAQNGE